MVGRWHKKGIGSDVETHTFFVDPNMFERYTRDNFPSSLTEGIRPGERHLCCHCPLLGLEAGRPWHNPGNYTQQGNGLGTAGTCGVL